MDSEKLLYGIGEVAQQLEVSTSTIRKWTNDFPKQVKPIRNKKGDRQYRKEDIEFLQDIKYLVNIQSLPIKRVKQIIRDRRSKIRTRVKVIETLKEIRSDFEALRKNLS